MSEILDLAQRFKTQSKQQVTIIEQEMQNATTQLSDSMTASLNESKAIMNSAILTMQTTSDQLRKSMSKSTQDALTQHQALTQQHLKQQLVESENLVMRHAVAMSKMIEHHQNMIKELVGLDLKKVILWGLVLVFCLVMAGVVLGALIVIKIT